MHILLIIISHSNESLTTKCYSEHNIDPSQKLLRSGTYNVAASKNGFIVHPCEPAKIIKLLFFTNIISDFFISGHFRVILGGTFDKFTFV